jgi:hypothetical protein
MAESFVYHESMRTRAKKVLVSLFLAFYTLLNLSVPVAQAQFTWYAPDMYGIDGFYMRVNDTSNEAEIFGERYTTAQVSWIVMGVYTFFLNYVFPGRDIAYCFVKAKYETAAFPPMTFATCYAGMHNIGLPEWLTLDMDSSRLDVGRVAAREYLNTQPDSSSWYGSVSNNPISGVGYVKERLVNFKIITEAQAQTQGFGFTAAGPVISLWRFTRDTTYFLMVLVIIAMAFMIMFRVRLSPQTVITVQSAIPKVAIALILITFSYAIAGFMIDLMYVVLGLVAGIISSSGISNATWPALFGEFTNPSGVFEHLMLYGQLFGVSLLNSLSDINLGFAILGGLAAPLLNIIILLYLVLVMLKVAWMLIKNYVMILITIVVGPVEILLGTLAGGGFGNWLKRLVSYLAVYPITAFLLFFTFVFLRSSYQGGATGFIDVLMWALCVIKTSGIGALTGVCSDARPNFPFGLEGGEVPLGTDSVWVPPFTVGSDSLSLLWLLASLVILSLLPKATQIAQAFIMGGRFEMKSAMGEMAAGLGVAATPLTYPISRTAGAAMDETSKEMGRRISAQLGKSAGVLGKKLSGRR